MTVFFPFPFNWKYIPCRSGTLSYLLLYFWYPRGIEEILVSGVNKWGSLFSWHKPHFHLLKAGDLTPFLPACWLDLPLWLLLIVKLSIYLPYHSFWYRFQHCPTTASFLQPEDSLIFSYLAFLLAVFFLCHFHVCWGWANLSRASICLSPLPFLLICSFPCWQSIFYEAASSRGS